MRKFTILLLLLGACREWEEWEETRVCPEWKPWVDTLPPTPMEMGEECAVVLQRHFEPEEDITSVLLPTAWVVARAPLGEPPEWAGSAYLRMWEEGGQEALYEYVANGISTAHQGNPRGYLAGELQWYSQYEGSSVDAWVEAPVLVHEARHQDVWHVPCAEGDMECDSNHDGAYWWAAAFAYQLEQGTPSLVGSAQGHYDTALSHTE